MKNPFGDLFKPIGPETATSRPTSSDSPGSSTFPLNEFLLALAIAMAGALVIAGAGFGISGPQNELVGERLGNIFIVGMAVTAGSFVGGALAGGFAKELVGPFSAVPIASMLLMGIWIAAGVTDSLLLLAGTTFVPMGAGVAVGFMVKTGVQVLSEKSKERSW